MLLHISLLSWFLEHPVSVLQLFLSIHLLPILFFILLVGWLFIWVFVVVIAILSQGLTMQPRLASHSILPPQP